MSWIGRFLSRCRADTTHTQQRWPLVLAAGTFGGAFATGACVAEVRDARGGIEKVTKYGPRLQYSDGRLVGPFPLYQTASEHLRTEFRLRGGPQGDIVVATYPKCGTTLMQQIVLTLLAQGDGEKVKKPTYQAPWLEAHTAFMLNGRPTAFGNLFPQEWDPPKEWRDPQLQARRVFKTHTEAQVAPWVDGATEAGVPHGCKLVIVTRNPKDVAVSFYHHEKNTPNYEYTGDWQHFLYGCFLPGLIDYGDFWSWHSGWWQRLMSLPEDRVLWMSYEELLEDTPTAIKQVAEFLAIPASDEVVEATAAACDLSNMKANWDALVSSGVTDKKDHIRQGKAFAWSSAMSPTDSDVIDQYHEARCREEALPLHLFPFE